MNLHSEFSVPRHMPPPIISASERLLYFSRIKEQLRAQQAVLIAHYYTPADIQQLAEESGGFVSDSLEMAKFGQKQKANTLVIAGVRFMGETAKILNPEKRVIMPTLKAECSLDLGCPVNDFNDFCDAHPDRIVVVYANTSAAVKARADWVVTSSNALAIVEHLASAGQKMIWAPDRHLGRYLVAQTQADMLLWQGSCIVHEEFKAEGILQLKQIYPQAAILAHPESPEAVLALADVIGSTSVLLRASQQLNHEVYIVATDRGIFYKMRQASPHKKFIEAPTMGHGATCMSCAHCPWMAMNQLQQLEQALMTSTNEILLDANIIARAQLPLRRMIDFNQQMLI